MMTLALTAQEFGENGRAWVEAVSSVLDVTIAKVGVLGLAVIAVIQNLQARAAIRENKERLDRQGERIDQVALAVPVAANGAAGAGRPASPEAKGEE
jgi:hypothetical protein